MADSIRAFRLLVVRPKIGLAALCGPAHGKPENALNTSRLRRTLRHWLGLAP
jgi:hypothetical protein